MKFIRKKFVVRAFSVFTILTFLNGMFYPSVSYALTSGPHQPEYTSYEDAASTDMVNLLTGDFTFNMPILTVPIGNDGGFTVPLSYHAGIGLDQEASWVGLGWNINVGAITRGINGFPDDASGESQTVNVKDLTGRRGWSSTFLGTTLGWDSQVGHYGVINVGAKIGYDDNGITSVGIAGLTVGGGGVSFDAKEFVLTVVQVVIAIATYGASEAANIGLKIAVDVAVQLAMDAIMPDFTPSVATAGYWKYSKETDKDLFHTDYWIWLNQTRIEEMYGTLHLDDGSKLSSSDSNFPQSGPNWAILKNNVNGSSSTSIKQFPRSTSTSNKGAASDINIDLSSNTEYQNTAAPALLAYDNFHVNGPGISGSVRPYRLEVGSIAVPREMTANHVRLNPLPYLDYKVPFMYEGSLGNRYFHHVGSSSSVTEPSFYYGINSERESGTDYLRHDLTDVVYNTNDRVRSDVSATKKIAQGNHVDWLTNGEINSTTGRFTGTSYLDYFSAPTRQQFREAFEFGGRTTYYGTTATNGTIQFSAGQTNYMDPQEIVDVILITETIDEDGYTDYTSTQTFTSLSITNVVTDSYGKVVSITVNNSGINFSATGHIQVIAKGTPKTTTSIGGFCITGADGMNYHFSLPVYDYDFVTKNVNKLDANKNSTITRTGQFANTWLLTAITGPDFVDRGGTGNLGNGVVDESDWGYWIKFNYGRYTSAHTWRIPYSGDKLTSDDAYKVYAEGKKEKFYLNTIETRSHVAMFIKEERKDARDASSSKLPSLRLAEIALLTRDAYKQLTDASGGYQLKDVSGTITDVYRNDTFTNSAVTGGKATFIQNNALRRVKFNVDYSLCNSVPNSVLGYGKLTLNSISVLGRNNAKVFPDYKFTYANNPTYHADKWDGWGMYASNATATGTLHKASTKESDGYAWSLETIKSPLGNVVEVKYERDTYSSISNTITVPQYELNSTDASLTDAVANLPASHTFEQGERVWVDIYAGYWCTDQFYEYPQTGTGGTVSGNLVYLDEPLTFNAETVDCGPGESVTVIHYRNRVATYGVYKKGGNLRVKSITLKDEFNNVQTKTRYIYSQDTYPWGTSSGVVSVEPDYIRANTTTQPDFYNWLGYPTTPVVYGTVAVLTGKLTTDDDYHTKQVYEFETPHKNQYAKNANPVIKDKQHIRSHGDISGIDAWNWDDYSSLMKHEITRRTSKIGKLKSIKTYAKTNPNTPVVTQTYSYTDSPVNDGANNYQGVFTEGNLMFEIVEKKNVYHQNGFKFHDRFRYHRATRTTMIDYPWTLQKISTTYDGKTSENENKNWDLFTGLVTETHSKNALGIRMKNVIELAYKKTPYAIFGSKAENAANKNMMLQGAANYTYKMDASGNEQGLVGASASVWKNDWTNYRKLNGSNVYEDSNDLDENNDGTVSADEAARKVWRKYETYVWKGEYSRLNPDGTQSFNNATDKFNFSSPGVDSKWQRTGTQARYNHYSALLESKDMNGLHAASKVGYNDQLTLASASNSEYTEMAFSSAEDRLSASSPYFGGEVALGSGTVVSSPVHTGTKALSVSSGTGFVFKSSSVAANKTYRASVWANTTQGRLYYKIGGTEYCPTPGSTPANLNDPQQFISTGVLKLDGSTWYRIDLMNIPASSAVEVGVKSANGTAVVFDDFRFQPTQSGMTAYVYNPSTKNVEYVLDNDNLFTRYEYNDRGLLIKTYRESIKYGNLYGEKLVTQTSDDYRRFHVDQ